MSNLADRYVQVRNQTLALGESLRPEDFVVQSMEDASPTKWHFAHTTWFFETFVLSEADGRYQPFDPSFRALFNSYYNAVGVPFARAQRGLLSRPTVDDVFAYRRYVDAAMLRWLETANVAGEWAERIDLGLQHEQQHQELVLTDLKHALAHHPSLPVYRPGKDAVRASKVEPQFLSFEGGLVEIGHAGDGFAFDNERARHRAFLEPYALATLPVTCAEYLEFMNDGGYAEPRHWLSDGWHQREREAWQAPMYWFRRDDAWWVFTLSGAKPVDGVEPVCHVSYYEADAYATWAGARLPTEVEWEVAAQMQPPAVATSLEMGHLHPVPVDRFAIGNVWEWTRSAYLPYPRFQPGIGAIGEYNGKFMCNQFVLRGASCVTPRSHMRLTYRNFFPPEKRWQFSGIRLAKSEAR